MIVHGFVDIALAHEGVSVSLQYPAHARMNRDVGLHAARQRLLWTARFEGILGLLAQAFEQLQQVVLAVGGPSRSRHCQALREISVASASKIGWASC